MGLRSSTIPVPLVGFASIRAGTGARIVLDPHSRHDRDTGLTVWTEQDGGTEYVRTGYGEVVTLAAVLAAAAVRYESAYSVANTWPGGGVVGGA
jgi:hypothetical protein